MLKIYNTLGKKLKEFKPIKPGQVSIYVCGPTVYDYLHVGNFRGPVFFNFVKNWLEHIGYKVEYALNFTDVEDKIIRDAKKAKKLISAGPEEQKALFNRLKKMGFAVNSIGDILALEKEDYLNRRLQTILVHKKLATTSKSARQLITHKHVLINGEVVNTPSYIVPVIFEDKISLKSHKVGKKESKKEEENKEQDEAHTVKEITNRLQNE